MKLIRLCAALLMVVTGVLHVLPMFREVKDPNALPMLGFAVLFLLTGILLFLDKKAGLICGIVFPLVGLVIGFFKIGVKNWDTLLTIMFVIDAIVVISCLILFFCNRQTKQEAVQ